MRKKKNKIYFSQETEDGIIQYNKSTDSIERNRIYNDWIKYSFEKLAENMVNTFSFPYIEMSKPDLQAQVVSMLIEKIYMYQQDQGKAFSYFSVTAKNYLIGLNNEAYKNYKKLSLISEMPETWNPENDFRDVEMGVEYIEFKHLMLSYWDKNLTKVFTKKRDIQIADAILELFRRSEHIENFNKKHLYLLIREMTDCKTHYITKVITEMKKHQTKMLNEYMDTGSIDEGSDEFWSKYVNDMDSQYVDSDVEDYYSI